MRDGKVGDWYTNYYDPIIDYNHKISMRPDGTGSFFWGNYDKFLMVLGLAPQRHDVARQFFDSAVECLGWRSLEPADESPGNPRATLYGLAFAREFGDDAVHAKLKVCAEEHHEPTLDPETLEFTWRFGLNEPHPRGQFNASAAMAESISEGAWWRLFNEPNLRKFVDPTVYGVDFPKVCLSQAVYDESRRMLDRGDRSGDPGRRRGESTTFRVTNVNPKSCTVIVDGERRRRLARGRR